MNRIKQLAICQLHNGQIKGVREVNLHRNVTLVQKYETSKYSASSYTTSFQSAVEHIMTVYAHIEKYF